MFVTDIGEGGGTWGWVEINDRQKKKRNNNGSGEMFPLRKKRAENVR